MSCSSSSTEAEYPDSCCDCVGTSVFFALFFFDTMAQELAVSVFAGGDGLPDEWLCLSHLGAELSGPIKAGFFVCRPS